MFVLANRTSLGILLTIELIPIEPVNVFGHIDDLASGNEKDNRFVNACGLNLCTSWKTAVGLM